MNLKIKNTALIGAAVAALALSAWAEPAHAGKYRAKNYEQTRQAEAVGFNWFGDQRQLKRKARHARSASYRHRIAQNREPNVSFFQPAYAMAEQKPRLSRKRHVRAARTERTARPIYHRLTINTGFGSTGLIAEARRYLGGNPTGRSSLWCANFMNMVLQRSGHKTTGSNMARSFASYGRRVSGPQVGAIAVMSRGKRGGHVGVVSGFDKSGNPIVISGNHGGRVAEAAYPRGRIYAYVMPTS
jgi:uncharacterized protein (TIGR02594 family)